MKQWGFKVLCAVAAAVTAVSGGGAAYGQTPLPPPEYRIVAIGDSLTVGYQPGMTESSIPYGYAERLYEQALFRGSAKLDTFGIIGLRTEGLKRLLQSASDGKILTAGEIDDFSKYPESERLEALADGVGARTAELKEALAEASIVTVTIGANDFSDFLRKVLPLSSAETAFAFDGEFNMILNNYAKSVGQVLRLTAELAPKADIYIADQYLPLPKLWAEDKYEFLYERAVGPITAAIDELAAELREEGVPVRAVHVAERFKGKEGSLTHMSIPLGAEEDAQPNNHPTDKGYQAMAEAFTKAVWNEEYRTPADRPEGVPISVIVAGKELVSDYKPVLKPPGITFIALRDVTDAMDAELLWDNQTQTVTFRRGGREVQITIGAGSMIVNGAQVKLAEPAYLQNVGTEKKTYVPLAVIADGLGFRVTYSKQLQTAFINP